MSFPAGRGRWKLDLPCYFRQDPALRLSNMRSFQDTQGSLRKARGSFPSPILKHHEPPARLGGARGAGVTGSPPPSLTPPLGRGAARPVTQVPAQLGLLSKTQSSMNASRSRRPPPRRPMGRGQRLTALKLNPALAPRNPGPARRRDGTGRACHCIAGPKEVTGDSGDAS